MAMLSVLENVDIMKHDADLSLQDSSFAVWTSPLILEEHVCRKLL